MATKVKGESIKEGSIPFSALENFSYDLSNEADYAKFKNALENEKAGFIITQNDIINNVYIIFTQNVGGNFYYLRAIDRTKAYETTIDISNNPTTIFRKKDEIDLIVPIDWNAQEGEAGYIKNRTHYIASTSIETTNYTVIKNIPKEYNPNTDRYYLSKEIYIQYNEGDYVGVMKIPINTSLGRKTTQSTMGIVVRDNGEEFIISSYYNGTDILFKVTRADVGTDFKVLIYTPLNNNYLPDTVLKTTPQSLSDTDKSQVLANLGIDPVVWKYICNPFVLDIKNPNAKLPMDLVNICINKDASYKPIMKNLLVIGSGDDVYPIIEILLGSVTVLMANEPYSVVIYADGSYELI